MTVPVLPRVLKYFNIFVDGIPYQAKCESVTLPNLSLVVEEYRGGGMDSSLEIDLGLETLILTMTISDCSPELMALLGRSDVNISLRSSMQAQGTPAEGVVITMRGLCKGFEMAEWQPGSKATSTATFTLQYFKYVQKDVEIVEIDVLNLIRKFNGVNQLAEHKNFLGI
ncbi:phage major tail tube protein [Bartonella harrusi]|uniref:Phage major tail tube protein n=1 Tax=Bartonella harrusi TaxID=2961895 RepID=A0ABY5ESM1_9HYPH|nr:phage major tail tube protein [Bartonella harrusi]UTO27861.1 phage major tail tube protein [Bartonella harrusi]UTO28689.1 phage major tail tube protein [Bartonella harrusi]UTO29058.1 phage major tail tube protein [Bartonella harrusi]